MKKANIHDEDEEQVSGTEGNQAKNIVISRTSAAEIQRQIQQLEEKKRLRINTGE